MINFESKFSLFEKLKLPQDGSELFFDYLFFTPPGNTLKNMELDFIPLKQRKAFDINYFQNESYDMIYTV